MEKINELLDKLYNYDNFGLYLIIAILLLVLLFVVVLFFGKKDKKKREVEATKKLEIINEDALDLENTLSNLKINNELEKTANIPNIENNLEVGNNNVNDNEINVVNEHIQNNTIIEKEMNEPLLQKDDEIPFNFVNEDAFDLDIPSELNKKEVEEVKSVPEFNFDEIMNFAKIDNEIKQEQASKEENKNEVVKPIINNGPQVFSSVYAPERKIEEPKNDELEFELPTLKQEYREEDNNTIEEKVEMPKVKLEEKEVVPDMVMEPWKEPIPDRVVPKFNSITLDELNGEFYNLK